MYANMFKLIYVVLQSTATVKDICIPFAKICLKNLELVH